MAVFSDIDIRAAIGNTVHIEGFDEKRLGPDSYDIDVGDIWRVTDPLAKEDILQVHRLIGSRGLNAEYRIPRLSQRQKTKHKNRVLNPREVYIAECARIETAPGIKARIVPKSGKARDGMHAFSPDVAEPLIAIVPYTFVHVPQSPVAQVIFYESPTPPVNAEDMELLWREGKLLFSVPKFVKDERGNGNVPMTFAPELLTYRGGELTGVDSPSKFLQSRKNSMFSFYLGITAEEFGTGDSHILWMLAREGHIYPNAPLCHANVQPQRHTLEVSLTEKEVDAITSNGKKPVYACSVRAYLLKTPTATRYDGKYNDQTRPLPKI